MTILGVHGEAGAERTKVNPFYISNTEQYYMCMYTYGSRNWQVEPADKVVRRLIDQIVSQEPGYQYFKAEPGMDYYVM